MSAHGARAQLPADKLAWLAELRAAGARVLAVGDGVNDAPVLAGADVAIALAEGAELAQASSDIVLTGARLDAIAPARDIAQQTLAIVRQNQRWAMFYNLSAVPLAALGFVPPWLAAFGMSAELAGRHPECAAHRADDAGAATAQARAIAHGNCCARGGRMKILLLLIPLSLLFLAGAVWAVLLGGRTTISSTIWTRRGCCRSTTRQKREAPPQ